MKFIANKKSFMVYPDDDVKDNWDLLVSLVLVYVSLVTPLRIAFVEDESLFWSILSNLIDFIFFMDIIITFNSAFYDEDFQIVSDRKLIAINYIRSWFLVDLFAIIPFDLISGTMDYNEMAKLARLSRMYKLIKLARLVRILKLLKMKNSFFKYANDFLKISLGFERLFFFILGFFLVCHIVGCLWILVGMFEDDTTGTWIEDY